MKASLRYYPSLTGVRAVAAAMIFLHHIVQPGNPSLPQWFIAVCRELHTGVPLFFVLSGFLIHQRYSGVFYRSFTGFLPYFRARFARIYPLFLVLTLIQLFYLSYRFHLSLPAFLESLFWNLSLLKGFSPDYLFSVLPQTWSLTVECSFYLLAPLILFDFQKNFWFLLLISLIMLTGSVVIPLSCRSGDFFAAAFTFAGRSFEFFVGCVLSEFVMKRSDKPVSGWPFFTISGLGGIGLCIVFLIFFQESDRAGDELIYGRLLNNLILPVFAAIFFWGLIIERSLGSILLSSRPFLFAGKISYAFFLVHAGLFQLLISQITGSNLILQYILLNGLAAILYYSIELPGLKFFRTLSH